MRKRGEEKGGRVKRESVGEWGEWGKREGVRERGG